MKRLIIIFVSIALILSFSSCKSSNSNDDTEQTGVEPKPPTPITTTDGTEPKPDPDPYPGPFFEAETVLREKIMYANTEQTKLRGMLENEDSVITQKEYVDALITSIMNEIDLRNKLIYGLDEYISDTEEKCTELTGEELENRAYYLECAKISLVNIMAELEEAEADLENAMEDNEKYLLDFAPDREMSQANFDELKRMENEANAEIEAMLAEYPAPEPEILEGENSSTYIPPVPSSGLACPMPAGVYRISSEYGWRVSWGRDDFHLGIDLAAPFGIPVYAAAEGTVLASAWSYSYGYYVLIDHGNGYATLYAHNGQLLVSEGDTVSQGQMIAKSGSSGAVSGSHLHFEVRIAGKTVNPRNYIKF